jgi:hypothetical protein
MAQAVGGLMHITGAPDGPPQKVGVAITDVMTGVLSAGAVCVAGHRCCQPFAEPQTGVRRCSTGAAAVLTAAASTSSRRCWRLKCSRWPTLRPIG